MILGAERKIHSVAIFNSNFERRFLINNNSALIPLTEIPMGRYTTEVKLNDKLIIITLLRNEPLVMTSEFIESTLYQSETFESVKGINEAAGKNLDEQTKKKEVAGYWIECKIQNGNSSRFIRRAGDINIALAMIEQNKLDIQTRLGKFNELTIWEIYDKKEFMKFKRLNPNYADATSSDAFNVDPYFNTIRDLN